MKAPFGIAALAALPPRPTASRALADTAMGETKAEEAAEPPVEAMPRLGKAVMGYMTPRPGIDGQSYFGACGSCRSFVPESAMRGAVVGARCALLGSNFTVVDDASCNAYEPWSDGTPSSQCVEHMANRVIRGERGAISPWDVGYVTVKAQCINCRQYDAEHSECELAESLNENIPLVFDINTEVEAHASCDLWTPEPPPDIADAN